MAQYDTDPKVPVTRRIKRKIFDRSKRLADKINIKDNLFIEQALEMYCNYLDNNPPCVSEHTKEKFSQLIQDNMSHKRTIKDLELRLKIVEGQIVQINNSNGPPRR